MRETKEPRREFAKYEELISDKPRFMERIRIDWDKSDELKNSYVGRILCIRSISEYAFSSNVVFFCGKNGSGKSTLLEAEGIEVIDGRVDLKRFRMKNQD